MDEPSRPDPARPEPGADGPAWRPSWGFLAVAAGLVAGSLAWWAGASPGRPAEDVVGATEAASAASVAIVPAPRRVVSLAAASAPTAPPAAQAPLPAPLANPRHVSRRRDPDGDQTPDLSDYVNDGDIPTTAEVIDRLHRAGIHEGLGAFNPPGTRPPLVGLAVPEGFELPPGYVRHYQATDDGQRIEPVLMFAPDAQILDANGQPVAIPADRLVPPELAPPGLPIRRITIPGPAGGPRRGP
jgi:hypothetical protein